jgi:hypothetical protein
VPAAHHPADGVGGEADGTRHDQECVGGLAPIQARRSLADEEPQAGPGGLAPQDAPSSPTSPRESRPRESCCSPPCA